MFDGGHSNTRNKKLKRPINPEQLKNELNAIGCNLGHGYGEDRELGEGVDIHPHFKINKENADYITECVRSIILAYNADIPIEFISRDRSDEFEKYSAPQVLKRRILCDRKIITLCGSSKFKTEFERVQKQLSYGNNCIVLSLDFFTKSENLFYDNKETKELAESKLRETHLAKISISDEIYVINKDGYIGESTSKEIEYAQSLGIPVKYLEPLELLDYNPDHTFKKGTVVKHFKRELLSEYDKKYTSKYLYLIEGTAMHTESGEELVIYKSLSEDMKIYARPASMFYGLVDKEKYPDIKQKYRFEEYIKD